jgi:hypothetical protein
MPVKCMKMLVLMCVIAMYDLPKLACSECSCLTPTKRLCVLVMALYHTAARLNNDYYMGAW